MIRPVTVPAASVVTFSDAFSAPSGPPGIVVSFAQLAPTRARQLCGASETSPRTLFARLIQVPTRPASARLPVLHSSAYGHDFAGDVAAALWPKLGTTYSHCRRDCCTQSRGAGSLGVQ